MKTIKAGKKKIPLPKVAFVYNPIIEQWTFTKPDYWQFLEILWKNSFKLSQYPAPYRQNVELMEVQANPDMNLRNLMDTHDVLMALHIIEDEHRAAIWREFNKEQLRDPDAAVSFLFLIHRAVALLRHPEIRDAAEDADAPFDAQNADLALCMWWLSQEVVWGSRIIRGLEHYQRRKDA